MTFRAIILAILILALPVVFVFWVRGRLRKMELELADYVSTATNGGMTLDFSELTPAKTPLPLGAKNIDQLIARIKHLPRKTKRLIWKRWWTHIQDHFDGDTRMQRRQSWHETWSKIASPAPVNRYRPAWGGLDKYGQGER